MTAGSGCVKVSHIRVARTFRVRVDGMSPRRVTHSNQLTVSGTSTPSTVTRSPVICNNESASHHAEGENLRGLFLCPQTKEEPPVKSLAAQCTSFSASLHHYCTSHTRSVVSADAEISVAPSSAIAKLLMPDLWPFNSAVFTRSARSQHAIVASSPAT